MPEYQCELFIKLKDVISDPAGDAVKKCLEKLEFDGIERLRIGGNYLLHCLQEV